MKRDVFVIADLRGDIQSDPREKWRQFDLWRIRCTSHSSSSRAGHIRYEVLIVTNFNNRFLVINRGYARAGKYFDIALGFQQAKCTGKVSGIDIKTEYTAENIRVV